MSKQPITHMYRGSFYHTPKYGEVEYVDDALILVDEPGMIVDIIKKEETEYQNIYNENADQLVTSLSKDQFFLPGFIDTHIHAPQWPQVGVALDEPLDVWLQEHTFPLEAKYEDINFAKEVYNHLVDTLLANGTTTALYFATVHREASYELAKICAEKGQRGLVGKVVMDNPDENPEFYRDASTEEALAETELFIQDVQKLNENVKQGVFPVVTPRFVPSCTDEALVGLGELAKKYDTHIQSHCSEGDWQHHYAQERFGKRDAEVLDHFGLFGKKSVMAHGTFLDESDATLFADTQTGVAHCPVSNVYLGDGVAKINMLKNEGVDVGLGSDVSGGYTPSLYENIRQTVMSARQLEQGTDTSISMTERGVSNARVGIFEALYLATAGGGEALNLPIGRIEKGYACDLQVLDPMVQSNELPSFGVFDEPLDVLQRVLYTANRENIRQIIVQGEIVHSK